MGGSKLVRMHHSKRLCLQKVCTNIMGGSKQWYAPFKTIMPAEGAYLVAKCPRIRNRYF